MALRNKRERGTASHLLLARVHIILLRLRLSRRDGRGSFLRFKKATHIFVAFFFPKNALWVAALALHGKQLIIPTNVHLVQEDVGHLLKID